MDQIVVGAWSGACSTGRCLCKNTGLYGLALDRNKPLPSCTSAPATNVQLWCATLFPAARFSTVVSLNFASQMTEVMTVAYKLCNMKFRDLAQRRVVAVLECIEVLLPGIDARRKKQIAKKILSICDGEDRRVKIDPAQAQRLVMENLQCLARNCPLLIFAEPLSRGLNEFFEGE